MGYIKKAYREILYLLDNNSKLPKGWDKFVKKQEKYQNLIIKSSKNQCYCTNCNYDFISKKKVNEEVKCPNCHNKYLIKRSNLRYFEFKDYLSILDMVNGTFVIRYFELKTIIDAKHKHKSSIVEFAREIPTNTFHRYVYVNDRASRCQGHIYIHHSNSSCFDPKKWREYTRNYSIIDYSIVFPNNIKNLLKDTKLKYSCIWDIAKHSIYIDLLELLKEDDNTINMIERLTKMKLYNLALRTKELNCGKSFKGIFGVAKTFYSFMKKHNITYTQLKLLRLLQEENFEKIKYLEKYVSFYDNTNNLEEISKYISLNRFIEYSKMQKEKVDLTLYIDYLRFAKELGFDLKNNRYAFPKNLKEAHDELEKQYEIHCDEIMKKAIRKRGRELSTNIYKNNKFIILPAFTLKSLQNESKQQNNCVRTYAKKYAKGVSDIYFMRNITNIRKSLVTVEVQENEVVQSRIKNNKKPNKEQLNFLNKWEQKVLKGVA